MRDDDFYQAQELQVNAGVRTALDQLDAVLAKNDMVAAKVWAVLTGLRGPDTAGQDYKQSATVKIRRAAFPLTTKAGEDETLGSSRSFPVADFGRSDVDNSTLSMSPDKEEQWHFNSHIDAAARALGLKVEGSRF